MVGDGDGCWGRAVSRGSSEACDGALAPVAGEPYTRYKRNTVAGYNVGWKSRIVEEC
jgi:hypothetical protein